jgi:hypothetical protein
VRAGYAPPVLRVVSAIVLVLAGILLSHHATEVSSTGIAAAFLSGACVAFVGAAPRRPGIGLILAAFFALAGHRAELREVDLYSGAFVLFGVPGALLLVARTTGEGGLFRRSGPVRFGWALVAASLPAWALANASSAVMLLALGLSIGGFALAVIAPLVSGRRPRVEARPDPITAPLVEVEPYRVGFTRGRKVILVLFVLSAILSLSGVVLGSLMTQEASLALVLVGGVLAGSFGMVLFVNARMGFRVDAHGITAEGVFRETTLPWTAVVELWQSRVPVRAGIHYRYYNVRGIESEITFPKVMPGSERLRDTVQAATGLSWGPDDV